MASSSSLLRRLASRGLAHHQRQARSTNTRCRCYSSSEIPSSSYTNRAASKWNLYGIPAPTSASSATATATATATAHAILNSDDSSPTPLDLSEDSSLVNASFPSSSQPFPKHGRRNPTKPPPTPSAHLAHKKTLKAQYPAGWNPTHKLSRAAMDTLRALHASSPTEFSTPVLAERFSMSPEAIRRILKSKWAPSVEEREKMAVREVRAREERKLVKREREKREWETLKSEMEEEKAERQRAWDAVRGVLSRGTEEVLRCIPEVSGEMGEEEARRVLKRDAERGVDVSSEVLSIVRKRRSYPKKSSSSGGGGVWTAGPDRAVTSKLSVV